MKNLTPTILFLAAVLLLSGCASTSSTHGAYPTLKQTRMMVDTKMTRYRNVAALGALTLGQRQQVDSAYASYEKAFNAAVQAAKSDYEVTTPDNVKTLANNLMGMLDTMSP